VTYSILVSRHENSLLRNLVTFVYSVLGCAPLEVVDVICYVVPLFSQVFSVEKLLVNLARLIFEFRARGPRSCECPVALYWVEHEFLNEFARVKSTDVASTVV